jgi:membrane-bound serine protease (ClpP class)
VTIFYIILLVLAAMAFVVVEILTPTFGLVALLGLSAAGGAVYFCFTLSDTAGMVGLLGLGIGLPIYSIALVKYLPRTALGKRVLLAPKAVTPGEGTPSADRLADLVGQEGLVQSTLRPSGLIRVDGQRVEARSEGLPIERGVRVKVIRAAGNCVVVRPVEES